METPAAGEGRPSRHPRRRLPARALSAALVPALGPAERLAGRVALVTGAGAPDGIGFATARMLGARGAAVAVTATTGRVQERVTELRDAGVAAYGVAADLTDEQQVAAAVAEVTAELGEPSVLVCNAGMTSVSAPVADTVDGGTGESGALVGTSLVGWHLALARNLDTAFLSVREVLPGMVQQGWGRVVLVSSVTGPVMAMRAEAGYAAAKAAMVGLARSAAVDTAASGVTVNAVAPGWIATGSQTADEVRQGRLTPVGRSGTAEEVAEVIGFLCSPGASYLTGQCLVVDGGNSIAEERGLPGKDGA